MVRILVVVGLAWAGPAAAFDIETTSEVWSATVTGQGGGTGDDAAFGAGLDGDGNVTAGGVLDGAANHGTDAYVASWDPTGAVRWEKTIDSGLVGATDSGDEIRAVSVDTTDQVTVAGRLASSGVADGALWLRAYDPLGAQLWERTIIDGVSPEQEAFGLGISPSNNDVFVAGWSRGDLPGLTGRWVYGRYAQTDGSDVLPLATFDQSTALYNPDQAFDAAIDEFGTFTVVGRAGVDGGSQASLTNDTQWMARRYDAFGVLVWAAIQGGDLDDEALAVVIDPFNDPIVAGFQNLGSDNADGRDDNWLVIKYSQFPDPYGSAAIRWTYTWGDAGENERATALAIDEDGDVLVAGTTWDAPSATAYWRVVELADSDGHELSERLWPIGASDGSPWAVAQADGVAVVAGGAGNGTDTDFYVSYLASDRDLDGTIDSEDGCPDNEDKIEEGICGCNNTDQDADGDGAADCDDICDGDPEKTEPGICGCGFSDADDDGDGIPGCHDACSGTPAGSSVDESGCAPGERQPVDTGGDVDVDPPEPPEKGCDTSGGAGGAFGVLVAGALALRRRARR